MGAPNRDDEAAVRALLRDWDVIGLRDEDSPRDEYDDMIGPLWALRTRGASAAKIARWVSRHAEEYIGLPSSPAADHRLAAAVLALP